MLNTYIYHQLPPTCFGVCYAIFRETIALLAQRLYAFCNVAIKCKMYTSFKFTMLLKYLKRRMHNVESFKIIGTQEAKLINNYRSTKYKLLKTSIIITKPTNALIVCNLFLNHFFKTLSLLLRVSIAYCLSSSGSTYSS